VGNTPIFFFQSTQLGLSDRWPAVKRAYAAANIALGDIIKVTPSSKVVGDLAQFMVQNDLDLDSLYEQAETLSFPQSVVEYFQGYLGIPHGGFPEALRAKVLKGKTLPNGADRFEGRPGAELQPYDFDAAKVDLEKKYGTLREVDLLSYVMYPKVFEEYMDFHNKYGSVDVLSTRAFVTGVQIGKEVEFELQTGKTLYCKLKSVGEVDEKGNRIVTFELNGHSRELPIPDQQAGATVVVRERANKLEPGSIGAPMPGVVVDLRVKLGDKVKAGQPLAVLSAMKMETVVAAPVDGKVKRVVAGVNDQLEGGDLMVELE